MLRLWSICLSGFTGSVLAAAAALPALAQEVPFSTGFQNRFTGDLPMPVFTRPENRFGATLVGGHRPGLSSEPSLLDPAPFGSPDAPSSQLISSEGSGARNPAEPNETADTGSLDRAPAASLAKDEPTGRTPPARQRAERSERSLGRGLAAWYEHPGRTASGEVYKPDGLTAAHRTLPFGTRVRVVNPRNGRSVVVRINDRAAGPRKIAIDLSRGAARRLGIQGIGSVAMYALPSPAAGQTPVAQMTR